MVLEMLTDDAATYICTHQAPSEYNPGTLLHEAACSVTLQEWTALFVLLLLLVYELTLLVVSVLVFTF
jgi:hypothetical protein